MKLLLWVIFYAHTPRVVRHLDMPLSESTVRPYVRPSDFFKKKFD